MFSKKPRQRSCIACRKLENWTDLIRTVLVGNEIKVDLKHRMGGRGAWLGITIRPLDKGLSVFYLNQQISPGILLAFSSSSKGIKDSNGQTAHELHSSQCVKVIAR